MSPKRRDPWTVCMDVLCVVGLLVTVGCVVVNAVRAFR